MIGDCHSQLHRPGGSAREAIFTAKMVHTRQTLFSPGNLAEPYQLINTDVHKRIRYLETEAA